MGTTGKVKSRWTRTFFTALDTKGDDEQYNCDICQKDFANLSTLTLHSQVHVIERKFRCEACQVSFHSQGHLQKHKRSSAHEARVQMTQSFGVPTSDNPRPYGCSECDTAFRKHGHLAKHLRSKSHITRLESRGLIPCGTYAALEKSGQDLKDRLVTTNYEQSLISMREIATQFFHQNQIANEPRQQTSYPTSDSISNAVGSPGMITGYPSTSMSAQRQQPVLSPAYYTSSVTPPHQQQASLESVMLSPAGSLSQQQQQQHHQQQQQQQQQQSISQTQPIYHHQQHQQAAVSGAAYMNESYRPQVLVSNMIPHHHHHQIHPLDPYTMVNRHQYQQ